VQAATPNKKKKHNRAQNRLLSSPAAFLSGAQWMEWKSKPRVDAANPPLPSSPYFLP